MQPPLTLSAKDKGKQMKWRLLHVYSFQLLESSCAITSRSIHAGQHQQGESYFKLTQWFLLCFFLFFSLFWEAQDLNVWYRRKSLSNADGSISIFRMPAVSPIWNVSLMRKSCVDSPSREDVRTADANYAKTSELVWQPTCLAAYNTRGNGEFIPWWQIPNKTEAQLQTLTILI